MSPSWSILSELIAESRRLIGQSNQPPFLQIILIDHRRRFGLELSTFLQESFDIFADQVRFQIHRIADLLQSQCRDFRRMGNNGHAE